MRMVQVSSWAIDAAASLTGRPNHFGAISFTAARTSSG